jgi:site-specific recombinase XerC
MGLAVTRSDGGELLYPDWFSAFMADRAVRKPSPHTAKAYRQDFAAIAILLAGDYHRVADLTPTDLTRDALQAAFAIYADAHESASIRRCWSTWNTLCGFLYTGELIGANPMPLIGRPKVAKSLPKSLGQDTVADLLRAIDATDPSPRRSNWAERDRAIVLIAVLAGLRADELVRTNIGDIRPTEEGGVVQVRGKGNKDRRIPVERPLIAVIEAYLDSRLARFRGSAKRRHVAGGLPPGPPLPRSSSAATVIASPAAHCSIGCCAHSRRRV